MTKKTLEVGDIVRVGRAKATHRVLQINRSELTKAPTAALLETADDDVTYATSWHPADSLKLERSATDAETDDREQLSQAFKVTYTPHDARADERVSLEFTAADADDAEAQWRELADSSDKLVSVEAITE